MHHIELYETMIQDLSLSYEQRNIMKELYSMPIAKASKILKEIGKVIDSKVYAYMTMETTLKLSDKMVEIPLK